MENLKIRQGLGKLDFGSESQLRLGKVLAS